jgi:N-ethylmaleimide reductase
MSKAWTDVVSLGGLQLKNRIVMSALTRIRCTEEGVPTDLVREYYTQRTGAGLILTECVAVSKRGIGYPYQGCLYSKEQAEAWKKVVDSVRSKGTKMFVQIYHAGRVTHPHLNGGFDPIAPSPIRTREKIPFLPGVEYPVPK